MTGSYQAHVEQPAEGSLWLVTFADLTAILVAFFVLIYSMSTPLVGKGTDISLGGSGSSQVDQSNTQPEMQMGSVDTQATLAIGYLSAVLSDRNFVPYGNAGPLSQKIENGHLVIRFTPEFAFTSRGTMLSPVADGVVTDLSRVFSSVANPVSVMTGVPSNNWSQAFARADNLAAAMRRAGYTRPVERFVAPGLPGDALLIVVGDSEGGVLR